VRTPPTSRWATTNDHWCTICFAPLCKDGNSTFRQNKSSFTPTSQKIHEKRSVTTRCSLDFCKASDASAYWVASYPWQISHTRFGEHPTYSRKASLRLVSVGPDGKKNTQSHRTTGVHQAVRATQATMISYWKLMHLYVNTCLRASMVLRWGKSFNSCKEGAQGHEEAQRAQIREVEMKKQPPSSVTNRGEFVHWHDASGQTCIVRVLTWESRLCGEDCANCKSHGQV